MALSHGTHIHSHSHGMHIRMGQEYWHTESCLWVMALIFTHIFMELIWMSKEYWHTESCLWVMALIFTHIVMELIWMSHEYWHTESWLWVMALIFTHIVMELIWMGQMYDWHTESWLWVMALVFTHIFTWNSYECVKTLIQMSHGTWICLYLETDIQKEFCLFKGNSLCPFRRHCLRLTWPSNVSDRWHNSFKVTWFI